MQNDSQSLTPEVIVTTSVLFLIRVDGQELALVDSEKSAKLAIDSICHAEIKRLEADKNLRTFRRDATDEKSITISTQALGTLVDGQVADYMKIDFIPVNRARVLRGRHEREQDIQILQKTLESIDLEKKILNKDLPLSERKTAIELRTAEKNKMPLTTLASLNPLAQSQSD